MSFHQNNANFCNFPYFNFFLKQEARQAMQAMAGRGEGITERNWKEVQDCLAPGIKRVFF